MQLACDAAAEPTPRSAGCTQTPDANGRCPLPKQATSRKARKSEESASHHCVEQTHVWADSAAPQGATKTLCFVQRGGGSGQHESTIPKENDKKISSKVRKRLSHCARIFCMVQRRTLVTQFRTARAATRSTDTESRCALQMGRLTSTRNRRVSIASLRTFSLRRRRTSSSTTPKRTSCAFVIRTTAIRGWPVRASGCIATIATSAIYLPTRG